MLIIPMLHQQAVPPEPGRKARRAQRKAARRSRKAARIELRIKQRKAYQARRAARFSYYVVNAGRGRSSTHIMRSTSPRTPNPASPGGIAAELLWFGGSAKTTLCGLAATRYVDVFSPSQASCRECKARWQRTSLKTLAALQGASPAQIRQTGGRNDYDSFLTGTPAVRPASPARKVTGDTAQWRAAYVPSSKEYQDAHQRQQEANDDAAQARLAEAEAAKAQAEARKAEAEAVKAQAEVQALQEAAEAQVRKDAAAAAKTEAKRQRRQARRTRVVQWATETREVRRQAAIDNQVMPRRTPKNPELRNLVK